MMRFLLRLGFLISLFAITSCGSRQLSIVDKVSLNSAAMTFTHQGAALAECGLVSQIERGRSSATNAGGSGCAACAQ